MDVFENIVAWRSIVTYQAVFALPVFLPVHHRPRMSLSLRSPVNFVLISIHQSASRTCQTMILHCSSFEIPAEFQNPARAYCSRVNSCFQRLHFVDQELAPLVVAIPSVSHNPQWCQV
ncbi:hypothetical protein BJV82DRAFT_629423 [Fennellomyces sp. T-0311]|nr:hypothetical protein BJV82DRAFT_629423 [Fennellomyces sp. T-0311]